MKILNLYAGIGGNRKLWGDDHDITAVEYNEDIAKIYQDFFPGDKMIVADAHQYLLDHFKEFDFIWSSPPCQSHTKLNTMINKKGVNRYPDMTLYQQIIFLSKWFYGKYVIENVIPYYEPLIKAQKVGRHLFWSNIDLRGLKLKENKIRIKGSTRQEKEYYLGFDLNKYNVKNKDQCLSNCVHPGIGKMILNKAMNILTEENTPQGKLF